MKKKTTQARVAEEVFQAESAVTLGGKTYNVAPPSVGTLILASEAIAELPQLEMNTDTLVYDVIREAKNCRPVGNAIAILILGAKAIKEDREEHAKTGQKRAFSFWRHIFPFIWGKQTEKDERGLVGSLAEEILYTATPQELQEAMTTVIQRMQLGDFFGLTTFLNGINTTRPTREVVTEETPTTASGRS